MNIYRMIYPLVAFFLFFTAEKTLAQTVTVTAIGYWDLANLTLEKARSNALESAKEEALRKAGIPEEFIVVNTSLVSDKFTRFISLSNAELSGEIVSYEILRQSVQNDGNRYFYMVEIKARVKTGKVKRDLEFVAAVEGIKMTPYSDGESFSFTIKPNKNCYVQVFWFDEEGNGACIYPNATELTEDEITWLYLQSEDYRKQWFTYESLKAIRFSEKRSKL